MYIFFFVESHQLEDESGDEEEINPFEDDDEDEEDHVHSLEDDDDDDEDHDDEDDEEEDEDEDEDEEEDDIETAMNAILGGGGASAKAAAPRPAAGTSSSATSAAAALNSKNYFLSNFCGTSTGGSGTAMPAASSTATVLPKLELLVNDHVLPSNMTIYQAIKQYGSLAAPSNEKAAAPPAAEHDMDSTSLLNNAIWSKVHLIHYRLAQQTPTPPAAPVTATHTSTTPAQTRYRDTTVFFFSLILFLQRSFVRLHFYIEKIFDQLTKKMAETENLRKILFFFDKSIF